MRDTAASCARNDVIETLSGAQLTAWQTGRLREVTSHAYREVPFYRKLWNRAGVELGMLRSLEDFARFPTISKHDLVQAGDCWTNPHQGPVAFSTRGTSGAPLLVWLSAEEDALQEIPRKRLGAGGFFDQQDADGMIGHGGDIGGGGEVAAGEKSARPADAGEDRIELGDSRTAADRDGGLVPEQ